ncbi:MAG: T9SS type A sorting domain-containing protein [Armatimonadetes bacterium]|nr:T9SS type A sorting domain-containing protein [Armatimonadota bacterium]
MKKIFIIGFICIFAVLTAIDFVPGTGKSVQENLRDTTEVYYHTNTDDQHWYGSDSWAVLFDFNNYFPSIDSLYFEADGALVYIPNDNSANDLTIKLYDNDYNQPGNLILSQTISPVSGWNEISFNDTPRDTVWLVIDYETNPTNQFISASSNDGTHSYYWDPNFGPDGFYRNMAETGFQSEFLFSLKGQFLIDGIDIELVDFELINNPDIPENYYPNFTVKNNSAQTVDNAYLLVEIGSPVYSVEDSISLSSLPSNEEVTFDFYGNDEHLYELLSNPSQYSVNADLNCEDDVFIPNNQISYDFNTFTIRLDKILIENFVQLNDINCENIWLDEQIVLDLDSCEVINYFPEIPDIPFYHPDSYERFNDYNLFGLPTTIIYGEKKILGYNQNSFADTLSLYYLNMLDNYKTFISLQDVSGGFNPVTHDAYVCINLRNENASIFQNYLGDCKMYVALTENNLETRTDIFGSVLLDVITEVSDLQLNYGQNQTDSIWFNLDDIEPISGNSDNCSVIFWVQNEITKQIDFINSISIQDFGVLDVNPQEVPEVPVVINIYPNPFSTDRNLNINIRSEKLITSTKIEIYNIKGQLVQTILQEENLLESNLIWNCKDFSQNEVASGIYFMKIELNNLGKNKKYFRNCLFIK